MAAAEIYALCCPDTGEIRYIGKANNSAKRLASHIRDSRRRTFPVSCWIKKLSADGKRPVLKLLEAAEDWREAERRWIAVSRARGDRLLNLADGGDEPFCSYEVRASNGAKVAQQRADDPTFYVKHSLVRRLGQMAQDSRIHGKLDLAVKLERAQQKVRAFDQTELFWRVLNSKRLAAFLPPHIQSEAHLYRGMV